MYAKICLVILLFTLQSIQAAPPDRKNFEHFFEHYNPLAPNGEVSERAGEKPAEIAEKADHKHKIEKLKHIAGKAAGIIQVTAEALHEIKHNHQDVFHAIQNLVKKLIEMKQADLAEHLLKDEEHILKIYGFDRHKIGHFKK